MSRPRLSASFLPQQYTPSLVPAQVCVIDVATEVAVVPPSAETIAAAALAASGAGARTLSDDPWSSLAGYAHFHTVERRTRLRYGEEDILARVSMRPDGRFQVALDAPYEDINSHDLRAAPRLARWPGHVTVFEGAVGYSFAVPDPLGKADEAAFD